MEMSRADRITIQLRELIETEFEDGDRLPSESRLAESLGVSRATLREAFSRLWQDGLIEKKWGVGTIVRKSHINADHASPIFLPLSRINCAPDLIRESGQQPSASDVSIVRAQADGTMAQLLDIREGDEFWLIDRVVLANGLPVQRSIDAVPVMIEGIEFDASGFDQLNNTLLDMLQAQLPSAVSHEDGRLSAVRAPSDTALLLGMREGEPVLLTEHTNYLDSGAVVTYTAIWYHPARVDVRFAAERRGAGGTEDIQKSNTENQMPPAGVSSYLDRLG